MLLAAGLGRRLLPLTFNLPKPVLPVLGRPLLGKILDRLGHQGVERAVVNLHHLPEIMRQRIEDATAGRELSVRLSHEETILGTAGGVRRAAGELCGDGPVLVHNGDMLADVDLAALAATHRASECPATLVLIPARPGYSVVDVDANGRVLSLAGVPEADPGRVASKMMFTGCHLIDEELLLQIPADRPSDIVRDVYRPLAREGRLASYVHDGFWWEFGSPELYLAGSMRLLELSNGELARLGEHDPVHPIGDGLAAVGAGARIDSGAAIRGRVAIGLASQVRSGSIVEDSVVMPEAWVGPRCRVVRSVVANGVELPIGFVAVDSVICPDPGPDADLPPETRRVARLLVHPLDSRTTR
jgi:mannose-1-phosphate guanylyltransferase